MKKTDRKFDIWKVDFARKYVKTSEEVITKVDYFDVLGISRNGSLVLRDGFKKKRWIKQEYFNSSDSPIWFETINKTYGYIIRERVHDDLIKGITRPIQIEIISEKNT